MLPNPANLKYPYPSTMLITTTSYVKSRPQTLEELASRNSRAKGTDPRQFYDPAPMEQLVKEGFVKRLYP